jgi:chromosome partitioning protein
MNLVSGIHIDVSTISIEVKSSNPALHARKRMQEAVEFAIERAFGSEITAQVKVVALPAEERTIETRKVLPGVKQIIAVASGKGGVGKSSLAVNLAAISASQGYRTLLIDLDTQCNSTAYLNVTGLGNDCSIADLFEQTITFHLHRRPASDFCHPTQVDNLDIIAGSERLTELESELHSRHKIYKLREALASLSKEFDHIYIDTAPALNFYSLSALIAADRCLIPIDCDDFSRQGLYSLQQKIADIKEDHNSSLEIEGIIANQFIANAKLPKHCTQ